MKTKHHGQMSESFLTAVFLSLSGGLQDAYTYLFRGKVFANAQTGNIVLMSQSLFDGDLSRFAHYFIPVLSFALGVAAAECIRLCCTLWFLCVLLRWAYWWQKRCGRAFATCSGFTGGSWWCWAKCFCCSLWAFCHRSKTCWQTPSFPSPAQCRCRRSAR